MFHPDGPTFWELARQALSSTTRGYDLLAPKFDVTPFRTPDVILRKSADYKCENLRPRCAVRHHYQSAGTAGPCGSAMTTIADST